MNPPLTPQQKKQYSYDKDCRNAYGQSDKASRKAVPRRKRYVNQAFRRKVKAAEVKNVLVEVVEAEAMQDRMQGLRRSCWSKAGDKPLRQYVARQKQARQSRQGRKQKSRLRRGGAPASLG